MRTTSSFSVGSIADHGAAHPVIDGALTVVAAGDDAVADGELLACDVDALAQATIAQQLGTRERVQSRAPSVVARDQDRLAPWTRGLVFTPGRDRGALSRACGLDVAGADVHMAAAGLLGDVVAGVATGARAPGVGARAGRAGA